MFQIPADFASFFFTTQYGGIPLLSPVRPFLFEDMILDRDGQLRPHPMRVIQSIQITTDKTVVFSALHFLHSLHLCTSAPRHLVTSHSAMVSTPHTPSLKLLRTESNTPYHSVHIGQNSEQRIAARLNRTVDLGKQPMLPTGGLTAGISPGTLH